VPPVVDEAHGVSPQAGVRAGRGGSWTRSGFLANATLALMRKQ
jgi:hypothetical protein